MKTLSIDQLNKHDQFRVSADDVVVWVRGDYDSFFGAYHCYKLHDVNCGGFFNPNKIVFID